MWGWLTGQDAPTEAPPPPPPPPKELLIEVHRWDSEDSASEDYGDDEALDAGGELGRRVQLVTRSWCEYHGGYNRARLDQRFRS